MNTRETQGLLAMIKAAYPNFYRDMPRADLGAVAAFRAFFVIYHRKAVHHLDRLGGAFPLALHASYAAYLAALYHNGALCRAVASGHHLLGFRDQGDDILRAGFCA